MLQALTAWLVRFYLQFTRELRWSYLPPLMVYFAFGVSALTGLAGTFFVKEYLGMSAAALAQLGFWVGIPWALKIPVGHLVDLLWKYKAGLVYLGATLLAASALIMLNIITEQESMRQWLPLETWYVVAAILAPIGYMLQDVVADAMTVEAVPRVDSGGNPIPAEVQRSMNTTVQMLGRVVLILGGVIVALLNMVVFQGTESLPQAEKLAIYASIFRLALLIPVISVLGVVLAGWFRRRQVQLLAQQGLAPSEIRDLLDDPGREPAQPNAWILGGGLLYSVVAVGVGAAGLPFGEELIFLSSFAVIAFLMGKLLQELTPEARATLLGTAVIIFCFRAVPLPGDGVTWWMIDELHFDQSFLAKLSFISKTLTLIGLFVFRRFMAEQSIVRIVVVLSLASFVLALPTVGMFYGLHEWTASLTHGWVDARFIALVDTALESPLGQVSMVPMLAWIASSAPSHLKATYFAVLGSFTNLALSASQLGAKHLNHLFVVSRQVVDSATHKVTVPADYSQLGMLLICVTLATLLLPLGAILASRFAGWRSA